MADKFTLLVEGRDEVHVLSHLLEHHQVPQTFNIKPKSGVENLLATLDVELIAGGLKRLGIIVDADADLSRRWNDLRTVLSQAGYTNLPLELDSGGVIFAQENQPVTVGVWIMPDNSVSGMLEDFVGLLVPPDDVLWSFAGQCVDQVIALDRRFPAVHRSKALIHTWLAWQEQPGLPLGMAIRNHDLDANAPSVLPLVNWLRQMFDPGAAES